MRFTYNQKLTLSAMSAALTLLMLYAACAIPYMKAACLFLSSFFIITLLTEKLYSWSILVYIVSSLIGFLILPDKAFLIPYVLLLGHYGIFKTFIDLRVTGAVVRSCLKMLYCNIFATIGIVTANLVASVSLANILSVGNIVFPMWGVIIVFELACLMFDWLYTFCRRIYVERIHPILLPKR